MGRGPTKSYHKDMSQGYVRGTLTCLTDETIKRETNTDFPLVLNIEPTNACNLKCYVCARTKSDREVGYIDFKLYARLIDECLKYKKLRMLNFHKDGESLLHPRIFEMIRYAKDKNVARICHINTNAVCLEGKNIEKFLLSGIDDVTISIDACHEKTFEKIKGYPLLKRVEENVINLFKKRTELKLREPFIRVKIMEYEDTYGGEVESFIKKWQGIADDVQVTGLHSWGGVIKEVEATDEVSVKNKRYPCALLWYMMAVNWNGAVSICNIDWNLSGVVGDANTESLHDIWNGAKFKNIRKRSLVGGHQELGICKECVVRAGANNLADWAFTKKEFCE